MLNAFLYFCTVRSRLLEVKPMTGRLAKLSTTEIWKIEVKRITSENVHADDILTLIGTYYIIEAWTLLVTFYGHSRTSEMKSLS